MITAVGAVVYRHDAAGEIMILLIRKRGGFWTLPKGHVELDETLEAALLRELAEETGMRGVIKQFFLSTTYTIRKRRKRLRKRVVFALVHPIEGDPLRPRRNERIVQARWMPLSQALGMIGLLRVRIIVGVAARLIACKHDPALTC